jgi:acetolactate synthase small subunit
VVPVSALFAKPEQQPTACFSVHAAAEAGVMPRVLELFAKRGLVPTSWHSNAIGRELTIDIQVNGLDRDLAHYVAACLRQIAYVDIVLTSEKYGPPRGSSD